VDDIFLAALLQDIAILGIDRAAPEFYRDLPRSASHRDFFGTREGEARNRSRAARRMASGVLETA